MWKEEYFDQDESEFPPDAPAVDSDVSDNEPAPQNTADFSNSAGKFDGEDEDGRPVNDGYTTDRELDNRSEDDMDEDDDDVDWQVQDDEDEGEATGQPVRKRRRVVQSPRLEDES